MDIAFDHCTGDEVWVAVKKYGAERCEHCGHASGYYYEPERHHIGRRSYIDDINEEGGVISYSVGACRQRYYQAQHAGGEGKLWLVYATQEKCQSAIDKEGE